jgi:hypothetical protein
MHYLAKWLQVKSTDDHGQILLDAVEAHLDTARRYLSRRRTGGLSAVLGHLQAAQECILRLAPSWYVQGCLPTILARARQVLDNADPRLVKLEALAKLEELDRGSEAATDLSDGDRQIVLSCLAEAN